jgi:hypothetical protein
MPVFNGTSYRPKGARGVGGGWWVNQARGNPRYGKRFKVTWDRASGYVFHDYGGGRRIRAARIGGGGVSTKSMGPNPPAAPSAPRPPTGSGPNPAGTQPPPRGPATAPNPPYPGTATGQGGKQTKPPGPARYGDDSTAAAERAQLRFDTAQKLAELAQQGAYDRADLAESQRRSDVQQGLDTQATRESANRAGLFYSGQLGKSQDELAARYARTRFDTQTKSDRAEAARMAARQALLQGATLEEAAISARNVDRRIAADQAAADARSLVPEPGPNVQSTAPKGSNSATRALSRFGAVRAQGLGGGAWRVRFKSGALRTLRLRNGRWEILRGTNWRPFH